MSALYPFSRSQVYQILISLNFFLVFLYMIVNLAPTYLPVQRNHRSWPFPGEFKNKDLESSLSEESAKERFRHETRDKLFPCEDITPRSSFGGRGKYSVLYNYFNAEVSFDCDSSVTYTTHAEWAFLDNLIPIVERWQGPVSFAVYAPGTDFVEAFQRIQYLRFCDQSSPQIRRLVSFHIFFDQEHFPNHTIPQNPDMLPIDCDTLRATVLPLNKTVETYKKLTQLTYPVNVGRNIAREMATTKYVFPSDVELYPSTNVIPEFLEMIQRNDEPLRNAVPRVFVFAVFEVEAYITELPKNKQELTNLLRNNSAVRFHKYTCDQCHRIPKAEKWATAPMEPGLKVFTTTKRQNAHRFWEPFYIGTKDEPMFDERLSWEGRMDKMTQAYALCLLDYDFHVLDNAFLVHRPGIKRLTPGVGATTPAMTAQRKMIIQKILPALEKVYGARPGCEV